jgi:hypothetical protein
MRPIVLFLIVLSACRPTQKSPPAAGDTVAMTDSVPNDAFVILTPKKGDTLVEGDIFVIRWRAAGIPSINLGAAMGGHDKGYLLTAVPPVPDSLAWRVPVGFVTGFGVKASSDMRLRLEDANDPARYVEAGPFTIIGNH